MRKLFYYLSALILVGCFKVQPTTFEGKIAISAQSEYTRTTIANYNIEWTSGDNIGLFIGDLHSNIQLYNSSSNVNLFNGGVLPQGVASRKVAWLSYYPRVANCNGQIVNGKLPERQDAPFDRLANFMVSKPISEVYDESNMPKLSLNFDTQLFGIVCVTIKNTNSKYASEKIRSIKITSSEGKQMTGDFSFEISEPLSTLSFVPNASCAVLSVFDKDEILDLNVEHKIYVFVRRDAYSGLQIEISTDNHYACCHTTDTVDLTSNNVLAILPLIDFDKDASVKAISKVACWGDSYTHGIYAYPPILQTILGCKWNVYDGGISGNRTIEIAARQGAIKTYVTSSFDFPNYGSASISGIAVEDSDLTIDEDRPFRNLWSLNTALLNPAMVSGIECNITSSTVTRLTSGTSKHVSEMAEIKTYAAMALRDVDVSVIYMGANGGYNNDLDLLVKQHWAMIDFTTKKKYIVMAFHNRHGNDVEGGYLDIFNHAFGDQASFYCPAADDGQNHVLDLRWGVVKRGEELLIKTGVYHDASELTQSDRYRLANGLWPYPFQTSETDPHPNTAGETAISYLIHDKMVKLKYLDDKYILDDPFDL